MATYEFDCPHCSATRVSSPLRWVSVTPESALGRMDKPHAFLVVQCSGCSSPTLFLLMDRRFGAGYYQNFNQEMGRLIRLDHSIANENLLVQRFDAPISSEIPEHLSSTVAKAYRSAERNFRLADCEDASATMYRRSIDVAIRELYPDVAGNLAPRIAKLTEMGALPSQMKDWADHIRWIGNDGAHEPEGVLRADLEILRSFTEAFLTYLVTMPFKVRLARGLIEIDGSETALAAQ